MFLLLFKIMPNAQQGWRNVVPGSLLASVLFFVILGVFPIYVGLFPPNEAYAVFGVFLVFTFWLYLLGFVFVLGVELNAFLQEPARSVALAETTQHALRGKATYDQASGQVQAESSGTAPAMQAAGVLGTRARSPQAQMAQQGESPNGQRVPQDAPSSNPARPSLAGRILGFVGLLVAVVLLRNRTAPDQREHQPA